MVNDTFDFTPKIAIFNALYFNHCRAMVCGSWKLSRWSKGTGGSLPQVPTLRAGQRLAEDHSSKVAMLREKFFPITSANLLDIESQVNQAPFTIEQSTTFEEITATIASCLASSATRG
jgi:hypothetical protein